MTNCSSELDLVYEFVQVCEILAEDLSIIADKAGFESPTICVVPRSKKQASYKASQLLFKKAVSSIANSLGWQDGTDALVRIKDTKTTHNWRLTHNTGDSPYVGITNDTCKINPSYIKGKNIILIDDIYTEKVYVDDDCIQTLLNYGAKNVILYTVAKTMG